MTPHPYLVIILCTEMINQEMHSISYDPILLNSQRPP